jgi:hypothetical protein
MVWPASAEKPPVFPEGSISTYLSLRLHRSEKVLKYVRMIFTDLALIKTEAIDHSLRDSLANKVAAIDERSNDPICFRVLT